MDRLQFFHCFIFDDNNVGDRHVDSIASINGYLFINDR